MDLSSADESFAVPRFTTDLSLPKDLRPPTAVAQGVRRRPSLLITLNVAKRICRHLCPCGADVCNLLEASMNIQCAWFCLTCSRPHCNSQGCLRATPHGLVRGCREAWTGPQIITSLFFSALLLQWILYDGHFVTLALCRLVRQSVLGVMVYGRD